MEPEKRKASTTCKAKGCQKAVHAQGLCGTHYGRLRRGKDVDTPLRPYTRDTPKVCSEVGCSQPVTGRGLCRKHYVRAYRAWKKDGTPLPPKVRSKTRKCRYCSRKATNRDLCNMHEQRRRRGIPMDAPHRDKPLGARRVEKSGYVYVKVAIRPSKWVQEHRQVMEAKMGRPLYQDEKVHHKNGVRHDNRPDNLELWLHSHPPGQRAADAYAWAKSIVSRYEGLSPVARFGAGSSVEGYPP